MVIIGEFWIVFHGTAHSGERIGHTCALIWQRLPKIAVPTFASSERAWVPPDWFDEALKWRK
jgi:hypothetical protein